MLQIAYLTAERFKKSKTDLDKLIGVVQPYNTKQIADARDKVDLSEKVNPAANEAQPWALQVSKPELRPQNQDLL
jgi:hypothetical protein